MIAAAMRCVRCFTSTRVATKPGTTSDSVSGAGTAPQVKADWFYVEHRVRHEVIQER